MRALKVLIFVAALIGLSHGQFNPSRFNFGTDWDFLGKNNNTNTSTASAVDYVTIWLNDPAFNQYWHGEMLKFCKNNGKTPVFYSYIIAKSSGLGDCDVSGGLCQAGAAYLKNNFSKIKSIYENYAQNTANVYGTERPVIWLMEPDYFQYFSGNQSVRLSYSDASNYMNEMIACVKKYLPRAHFSLDISPWNNDQASWINSFDKSKFSFMHTSGGRTEAGSDRIRHDNNNNVTWSSVNSISGKCIIADDGYGSGGASTGHDPTWDDLNNIKNRINNGVAAITQKSPNANWGQTIQNLKSSLSSISTKCGFTFGPPAFSLTVNAGSGGKVTKNPDASSFDSGTTVTLTAVPNSGYKFNGWSGDASGTSATITITMTSSKVVTANFVDVNAKPKFTLTVTTTGSGIVEVSPKLAEFDSGTTVTLTAYTVNGASFNGWGGALSGVTGQVVTLVMNGNKTVTAAFSGNTISLTNLLKNGDFSDGDKHWTFGAYEGAKAEGVAAGDGFKVTISKSGTEDWHIQLYQGGVSLRKGVKYSLSFTASSESSSSITVNVGIGVEPYTSFAQRKVNLTPTPEIFTITFTMKEETVSNARVEFNSGKATSGWKIGNIVLTEAVELDPLSLLPRSGRVKEMPVASTRRLSITWYDHEGRIVRHASGGYGTLIKQGIPLMRSGSYIVVADDGGRKYVKRTVVVKKY